MFKQIPPIGLFVLWLLLLTGTIFFSEWVQIKSHESSIEPSFENLTTTNAASKPKAQVHPEKAVPEDIIKYIFVKKGDTLMKLLVSNGVDVAGLLGKIGIEPSQNAQTGGTFAIAYAAHKAASPIRFPPTVALTPVVAKMLGKDSAEAADDEDDA